MRLVRTLAMACAMVLGAQALGAQQVDRDIPYSQSGMRLNLCRPDAAVRPALVVMVHGGSFASGSRNQMNSYCRLLARNGYVAATVSYRLTSQGFSYPAPVEDVRAAVAWARANAAGYGADPSKVVLLGYSAGGTLALSAGLAPRSGVAGIIDIAGVPDLALGLAEARREDLRRAVRAYLGGADAEAASPIREVSRGDPPVLILHGTADGTVLIRQSERLAARLGQVRVPHRFVRVDGGGHLMILNPVQAARITREVLAFLGGIDAR